MSIPVYVFTGFLESGKTKFIQETLEDERFNKGERTLLLVFEDGEEEYDISTYPHKNVFFEYLDQQRVTQSGLLALSKKYRAQRVVIELNGMQEVRMFYTNMPGNWEVAQEVMFADSNTILSYNANLRSLVVDKLSGAEMVVFNRVTPGQDVMPLHKLARAVNRRIDIVYDFTDGSTTFDEIEDPLPFDVNAPVIEIADEDYALWYRDMQEDPEKYVGKTIRFKAQVARLRKDKEGMFAPGRFVMTCCEADIQFMGVPCKFAGSNGLKSRSWVMVTAKLSVQNHALYHGPGPILSASSVVPAEPANPSVATF